jgi:hypothetical protein
VNGDHVQPFRYGPKRQVGGPIVKRLAAGRRCGA